MAPFPLRLSLYALCKILNHSNFKLTFATEFHTSNVSSKRSLFGSDRSAVFGYIFLSWLSLTALSEQTLSNRKSLISPSSSHSPRSLSLRLVCLVCLVCRVVYNWPLDTPGVPGPEPGQWPVPSLTQASTRRLHCIVTLSAYQSPGPGSEPWRRSGDMILFRSWPYPWPCDL